MNKNTAKGRFSVATDLNETATKVKTTKPETTSIPKKEADAEEPPAPDAPSTAHVLGRATRARTFLGNGNDESRTGQRTELLKGRLLGVDLVPRMLTDDKGNKTPKLHPITQEPLITAWVKIGQFPSGTIEVACDSKFWARNVKPIKSLISVKVRHVLAGDIIGDPEDKATLSTATNDGIGVDGSINPLDTMDYYMFIGDQLDNVEKTTGVDQSFKRQILTTFMQADLARDSKAPVKPQLEV